MEEIGKQAALLAGAFCLGGAFIVGLLFAIAAHNSGDDGEGCLGTIFALIGIALGIFFFTLAAA